MPKLPTSRIKPPRHIVWSTDEVDLSDPEMRRWYLKQVLTHGLTADIQQLDDDEVAAALDDLDLPEPIHRLWTIYFAAKAAEAEKPDNGPGQTKPLTTCAAAELFASVAQPRREL